MTGEITLTGQVLPIGGVREKALAAQRAGVKTVVLPKENEPDLAELPDEAKEALSFTLADSIDRCSRSRSTAPRPLVRGAPRRPRAQGGSRSVGFNQFQRSERRVAAGKATKGRAEAMANTRDRITDTAENVRPYVERAVKDEEVRENVKQCLRGRAEHLRRTDRRARRHLRRHAHGDRQADLQDSLRAALDDLRNAADRVQGRDTHTGRNVILLVTGIALGLLFNPVTGPSTRRWLSDPVPKTSSATRPRATRTTTRRRRTRASPSGRQSP